MEYAVEAGAKKIAGEVTEVSVPLTRAQRRRQPREQRLKDARMLRGATKQKVKARNHGYKKS